MPIPRLLIRASRWAKSLLAKSEDSAAHWLHEFVTASEKPHIEKKDPK